MLFRTVPSASTAITAAPLLSSTWTTVARPFLAAMCRGLHQQVQRQTREDKGKISIKKRHHSQRKNSPTIRSPLNRHLSLQLYCDLCSLLPQSTIQHEDLHLESTVGCVYEGSIADLPQDQQGTHLMALGNKTHHKVREEKPMQVCK